MDARQPLAPYSCVHFICAPIYMCLRCRLWWVGGGLEWMRQYTTDPACPCMVVVWHSWLLYGGCMVVVWYLCVALELPAMIVTAPHCHAGSATQRVRSSASEPLHRISPPPTHTHTRHRPPPSRPTTRTHYSGNSTAAGQALAQSIAQAQATGNTQALAQVGACVCMWPCACVCVCVCSWPAACWAVFLLPSPPSRGSAHITHM